MGPIKCVVGLAVAAALLPCSPARSAPPGPSFDCGRATTVVEKKICRTPQLADLDRDIAQLYAQALSVLSPTDADALRADQGLWLKMRDECRFQVPGNPHVTTDVEGCLADRMYTEKTHLQTVLTNKKFSK
jgi:uncharacterized protein YecT (DUF1311 family)